MRRRAPTFLSIACCLQPRAPARAWSWPAMDRLLLTSHITQQGRAARRHFRGRPAQGARQWRARRDSSPTRPAGRPVRHHVAIIGLRINGDDFARKPPRHAPRSYGCHAARLARKCPRAFLPSLIASVMLSKQTGERSTGADRPAQ
jgi:hypothetical protein